MPRDGALTILSATLQLGQQIQVVRVKRHESFRKGLHQAIGDGNSFYLVLSQDSAPARETLLKIAKDLGCSFPEEYLVHATNKYRGVVKTLHAAG